jgi:hypothetical protein
MSTDPWMTPCRLSPTGVAKGFIQPDGRAKKNSSQASVHSAQRTVPGNDEPPHSAHASGPAFDTRREKEVDSNTFRSHCFIFSSIGLDKLQYLATKVQKDTE